MDVTTALEWAAERSHAVLITNRRDGRAQSSDISYMVKGDAILISVTADRAKTKNVERDPRVVVHVTAPETWSYISFDGPAELSAVATDPDDATCDALVAYYEAVAGKSHPDWAEYRAAMVSEGRLLMAVRPSSAVGQIKG